MSYESFSYAAPQYEKSVSIVQAALQHSSASPRARRKDSRFIIHMGTELKATEK